jgi:hypothetical protein
MRARPEDVRLLHGPYKPPPLPARGPDYLPVSGLLIETRNLWAPCPQVRPGTNAALGDAAVGLDTLSGAGMEAAECMALPNGGQ